MNETATPINSASQSAFHGNPKQNHPFHAHFKRMESKRFLQVVDAMLKRPAEVVHELIHGTAAKAPMALAMLLLACLAGTGLMMGSFSGGIQLLAGPLKVVVGTLASGLICLPSLYILLCLCGGNQNFPQTGRMLLFGLALSGILFIGFMPVAWIFSQATESLAFMGVLYLFIWGVGPFFGLRLMRTAFQFLNEKEMGALRLWIFIFAMVLLQMSTTLRPIIGKAEPLKFNEKQFFLSHWSEAIQR